MREPRSGFTLTEVIVSLFLIGLGVLAAAVDGDSPADGVWCRPERFGEHALPTVMKKVARHALGCAAPPSSRG